MRIEARIDAPQLCQTSDGQSRTDQQHDGERHLGDHECALDAMAGSAGSPATLLERFVQIRLRSFERRREAKKNSREQRDADGKDQHVGVKSDLLGARQSRRATLQAPHECPMPPEVNQARHRREQAECSP